MPWYEASILMIRSRPVKPRAMRTASSVGLGATRGEAPLRLRETPRQLFGDGDVVDAGLREVRATAELLLDRSDDDRMRVADDHHAEAVVKVDVFVAVDIAHPAALPTVDEHRQWRRVLE